MIQHDNPYSVMQTLAKIEDDLAEMQTEHADLQGAVKGTEQFIKTLEATCYDQVAGDSAAEKKERAKALMHSMPDYMNYLRQVKDLQRLNRQFDYLDSRKSICQSILGYHKQELATTGAGQQQGQADGR